MSQASNRDNKAMNVSLGPRSANSTGRWLSGFFRASALTEGPQLGTTRVVVVATVTSRDRNLHVEASLQMEEFRWYPFRAGVTDALPHTLPDG